MDRIYAKCMASVTIGSRILEDSIAWGKGGLSDKFKTALSSSGIDEEVARRIAKMHLMNMELKLHIILWLIQ